MNAGSESGTSMKSAIFGAALAAAFALCGAPRRDPFVAARANSGVRSRKEAKEVPSAASSLGLRPFRVPARVNGRRGAKTGIATGSLAILPKAAGRTDRFLVGAAGRAA